MAMTTCTECSKPISDQAEACPHCGYKPAQDARTAIKADLNRKMGWKEITMAVIVVLGGIGWMIGGSNNTTPSSASPAPPPPAATPQQTQYRIKATANELFKAYEENEVATDDKLRGNSVLVTGKVQAIDKDFMDNAIVQLATSNQFMPVRLTLKDDQKPKVALLKKGDKVEIECEKMARIVGSPVGRDCFFP